MALHFFLQIYPPNHFTLRWPNELWQHLVSCLSGYIDLTNEDVNDDQTQNVRLQKNVTSENVKSF